MLRYPLPILALLTLIGLVQGCEGQRLQGAGMPPPAGSSSPLPSASQKPSITATELPSTLEFPAQAGGNGLLLRRSDRSGGSIQALSAQPAQVLMKVISANEAQSTQPTFAAPYKQVAQNANGSFVATADVHTANGSTFALQDVFVGTVDGWWTVSRQVTVTSVGTGDLGFSSRFAMGFSTPADFSSYHFFAPGLWYDKNQRPDGSSAVAPGAIAGNANAAYTYYRETRSALPAIAMQDDPTGTALTLAHLDPNSYSGADETNAAWLVDATSQYASLGTHRDPNTELAMVYPAWEGEVTYVDRSRTWVRRSHPVTAGFTHSYNIGLRIDVYQNGTSADFITALSALFDAYLERFRPPVLGIDPTVVMNAGMSLLSSYSAPRGPAAAQGVPFATLLPSGDVTSNYINYMSGYVGMQLPVGFQLLRQGTLDADPNMTAQGEATIDFWVNNGNQVSGLPLTWFNVDPATFRDDNCQFPIFLRIVNDGMEGALLAAQWMRTHNQPRPAWEHYVNAYGRWLVSHQNSDGSFYRAYNPDGTVFVGGNNCNANGDGSSKRNSALPVQFLVALHAASGDANYLQAATRAGNYAYDNVYKTLQFSSGTTDNPDTLDREAAALALGAFVALYDATSDTRWLDAASTAADVAASFGYGWTYAIKNASAAVAHAGLLGQSLIATGQSASDVFLASTVFNLYRLHLWRDTPSQHYFRLARMAVNNTKLTTQLGLQNQDYGYGREGLVGEAIDLSALVQPTGVSSQAWLPWITMAQIQPLQQLQDTFGIMSVDLIDATPLARRQAQNANVYPAPGSIGWSNF